MDRIEHSLEDLQSPTCPNCGIEMHWYRSELVRFAPATNLNLFNCPACLLFAESETVHEPVWATPTRLCRSSSFLWHGHLQRLRRPQGAPRASCLTGQHK
jgi:hypothetical protein